MIGRCIHCNHKVSTRAPACPQCGAPPPQAIHCTKCGKEMLDSDFACSTCGAERYQKVAHALKHSSPSRVPTATSSSASTIARSRIRRLAQGSTALALIAFLVHGYFSHASYTRISPPEEPPPGKPPVGSSADLTPRPPTPEEFALSLQNLGDSTIDSVQSVEYWCDPNALPLRPKEKCKKEIDRASGVLNEVNSWLVAANVASPIRDCLGLPISDLQGATISASAIFSSDNPIWSMAFNPEVVLLDNLQQSVDPSLASFSTDLQQAIGVCRNMGALPR